MADETDLPPGWDKLQEAVGQAPPQRAEQLPPGWARLQAAVGKPEWADPAYPPEARQRDLIQTHIEAGHSFEDAAPSIQEHLGTDPQRLRPAYRLEQERARARAMGSDWLTGNLDPSTLGNVGSVLPFAGTAKGATQATEYGRARDRLARGRPTEADYGTIAQYEEQQKRFEQSGLGQRVRWNLSRLPAFAAEATLGGAVAGRAVGAAGEAAGAAAGRAAGGFGGTAAAEGAAAAVNNPVTRLAAGTAVTPALWAEQGAKNLNEARDRDSFLEQAKAYGAAFTAGAVQNAVLGRLSAAVKPGASFAGTLAQRTGAGVLEQQAADVVTSAAGLTTGYGLLGDLARGKGDDAGKNLAVQILTFGTFAALHKNADAGRAAVERAADRLQELEAQGVPAAEAFKTVAQELPRLSDPGPAVDPAAWTEANAPGPLPEGGLPAGPAREAPPPTPAPPGTPGPPPAAPEPPRQRVDRLQAASNDAYNRVRDTETQLARVRDQLAVATGPAAADLAARERDLAKAARAARRAHQAARGELDAARDELMKQPAEGIPQREVSLPADPVEAARESEQNPALRAALDVLARHVETGADTAARADAMEDAFTAAGLTAREKHALREALANGTGPERRTLDDIAMDDVMLKPNGRPLTRERVRQILASARGKLGIDRTAFELELEQQEAGRKERLAAQAARGAAGAEQKTRKGADYTPPHLGRARNRVDLEQDRLDDIAGRMERIADQIEELRANGTLTAELERQLQAQARDLYQGAGQAGEGGQGAAAQGLRRRQPGGPAPVQDEGGGGLRPGDRAAAPAPAAAGAEPAQAPAVQGPGGADPARGPGAAAPAGPGGPAPGDVNPVTKFRPGDPIPGVTRGAHATTPEEQAAVDAAIAAGAVGAGGRVGLGAAPAGFGAGPPGPSVPSKVRAGVEAAWRLFDDNARSLLQQAAPRTSRIDEAAGNSIARYAAVADDQARSTDHFTQSILGPLVPEAAEEFRRAGIDATPADVARAADEIGKRHMATMVEERLRKSRGAYQTAEADALERAARATSGADREAALKDATAANRAAENVRSLIGVDGTRLGSEKEFRDNIESASYKAFRERWKPFSDKLDQLYRVALDIDKGEMIDSASQLDGGIFHAKAIREGETLDDGHVVIPARGNLENPRVRRLGSSFKFTGAAEGYDIDPGRVIAFSLGKRMRNAAKANMYRKLVDAGLAHMHEPGDAVPEGWRLLPTRKLPPGVDAPPNAKELNLVVHPEAYPEAVRALELSGMDVLMGMYKGTPVGQFFGGKIPLTQTAAFLNTIGIAEGLTHTTGNIVKTLAAGGLRSLPDMIRTIYGVMRGTPKLQQELLELAPIGALKPRGVESSLDQQGVLWGGRTDPTSYVTRLQHATTGKFMDRFDDALRLTMSHAFDRIARAYPGVVNTEGAKRDFINQLGNYQRQTQHWAVALLRDVGIGPFATAATNNVAQSIRALTLGRGIRTADWRTDLALRGEMALQVAGVLGTGFLLNYLLHRRVDGDENTPLGGLKLPGDNGYIDLANLANLRRGSKTVGLEALIEGARYGGPGASASKIAGRAKENLAEAVAHPLAGPLVDTVRTAAVGKNAIGMEMVKKSELHEFWPAVQAALVNANPSIASAVRLFGGTTRPGKPEGPLETVTKGLGLGGIIKRSHRPPGKPLPTY